MFDVGIVRALSAAEFKTKFAGSFRGFLWSFVKPFLFFALYYVVFTHVLKSSFPNYTVHLFSGIVIWSYVHENASAAIEVFRNNISLISKFSFAKTNLILAVLATNSVSLVFNLFLLFIVLIPGGFLAGFNPFLFLLSIAMLGVLAFTVALWNSMISTYFEDYKNIWDIISQFWFWLTPIAYPLSQVNATLATILKINPLTWVLEGLRSALGLASPLSVTTYLLVSLALIAVFLITLHRFNRFSRRVIDLL